jgi:hypothetical protein
MSVGLHTVTLTPMAGGALDISCLVDSVSVQHGRQDTDSQPEASSCTLEVSLDSDDTQLPPELDVGASLTVTTTLAGVTHTRFSGTVTDVSQGWDEAGTDTPDRVIAQVIAASPLADLGRRVVGDVPWPQQLDGARVASILAAAGVSLDPLFSDPGTVQILARDVDSQTALDLAQAVAADSGGLLWDTCAGEIRYADAEHRRSAVVALELDACDVLVTPTWRRSTEGLVNSVSIGYGVAPDGGEAPRYVDERADSIATWGEFALSATTQLAAAADAQALGRLLLTQNHEPVWIMSELPVDMAGLSNADTATLLGLDVHSLLSLTGLPAAGKVPTSVALWVEGWTETLAWGAHEYLVVVSGYCRTSAPPRWNDLLPATTWDSVGASPTWDSASCLGPLVNLGRWDDQPASQRWDTTDPAVTWDNYQPTTS